MSGKRVIMFAFGGRRGNLELQLPFIRDILERHPNVSYHLWDLARDPEDSDYMQRGLKGIRMPLGRFRVLKEHAGPEPWKHFGDIYRHYANSVFQAVDFVKLDDDVVFIESRRFDEFLRAIHQTPRGVVSAKVINNGACTATWPKINQEFTRSRMCKLLDVHKRKAYAELSHGYFFDHWESMVDEEPHLIPTQDWLSINMIGYNWQTGVKFTELLDTPSPRVIAGRPYRPAIHRVGDEGAVNMLPRYIVQGFTAAHLYFGPQARQMPDGQIDGLRRQYAEIGQKYLAR